MIIKKKSGTFNTYSCELSWGQLNALYRALEQDHSNPLADEAFAELGWYLQNVPGPGEDEDEYKQAKDAEKDAVSAGAEGGAGGAGGGNPDLLGQELEAPPGEEVEGSEGPVPPSGPEAPPDYGDREPPQEADQYLEAPEQQAAA